MSDELKPCPFCGGPALFKETGTRKYDDWLVYCTKCGCRCPWEFSPDKESAMKVWNTRVPESEAK